MLREQSARKLEERSRSVGLERRREWRETGNVWRDGRTERAEDPGERVPRLQLVEGDKLRLLRDPRTKSEIVVRSWDGVHQAHEHMGGAPPLESHWHSSRAKTKRELFDRVDACGTEATKIAIVCRNCKDRAVIEVGCGSKWFCPTCRLRQVVQFRKDFERKRLGLVTAATRAGLTRRNQKKGERWGERLVTFTLPHRGTPEERIEVLRATWLRFWRLIRSRLAPSLRGSSGISFDLMLHNFPDGRPKHAPDTLTLLDVLSYLHVFEWTPGSDGLGHPHLHVWLFSRYIDNKEILHPLWERAHREVLRARCAIGPIQETPLLVPDVQAADDKIAHELIKYLTKDWEVSDTGAKRAAPDVFARVYGALDGKRLKQSSAGFAKWAVEKANICPCCLFQPERGHWARIDIEHSLESASRLSDDDFWRPIPLDHVPEVMPAPLVGVYERARELRALYVARRDATVDARAARREWDAMFPEKGKKDG